jgi:hypothetical protein
MSEDKWLSDSKETEYLSEPTKLELACYIKTQLLRQDELQALRDWKAKARPFLERIMKEPMNFTQYKELTELIKGAE